MYVSYAALIHKVARAEGLSLAPDKLRPWTLLMKKILKTLNLIRY